MAGNLQAMWLREVSVFVGPGWLYWVIVGLIAGWLTGTLMRGKGFGCFGNLVLGLIGAVIGGWLFSRLGVVTYGFFGSLAAATIGAVLLVGVAKLLAGNN